MSEQGGKPFRIAIQWLYYGHENAQWSNPIATELMAIINKSPNKKWVNIQYVHQVREIVSVAELYIRDQPGADKEEKATAREARAVVKRGRQWLSDENKHRAKERAT